MKPKRNTSTIFASRFRQLRVENGWSMNDFCQAYEKKHGSGVSKSSVSRWESGEMEPMVSTVGLIASVFGVSPVWLIGETDDRHHESESLYRTKDEYTATLTRVYDDLSERNRVKLLAYAYDLWDEEQLAKGGAK